ncbi:MAG: hypothetical protein HP494_12515 [Nitrospira sp.]|nr:hypothetical protein [Nitrospira sp.]
MEGWPEIGQAQVYTAHFHAQNGPWPTNKASTTDDIQAAQSLAGCPALAVRWRETVIKRVAEKTVGSTTARLYGPNL